LDGKGAIARRGGGRNYERDQRARLFAAADAERRELELELHDGLEQQLVLVGLKLGFLQRTVDQASELAPLVDDIRADLDESLRQLRRVASRLYPSALAHNGVAGALAIAIQRVAIPTTLHADGSERYPAAVETAVYFACLKALDNAARHAGIAHAEVRLTMRRNRIRFEVADNGRGADPERLRASTSVRHIADRLQALGGSLELDSAPGRGTVVAGVVPVT